MSQLRLHPLRPRSAEWGTGRLAWETLINGDRYNPMINGDRDVAVTIGDRDVAVTIGNR